MAGELPDIHMGGKKGSSIAGSIIGGIIGQSVGQSMSTRGEAKRSQIRMTEASHAVGLAERLISAQSGARISEAQAHSEIGKEHHALGASRVRSSQFEASYPQKDTDVSGEHSAGDAVTTPAPAGRKVHRLGTTDKPKRVGMNINSRTGKPTNASAANARRTLKAPKGTQLPW